MARQVTDSPTTQERLTMSYEEFLAFGEDTTHAEWVEGEVIVLMPPKTVHARTASFLLRLLSFYADLRDLGEVIAAPFEMRILPGRSSREPDILFVAREHLDRLTAERLDGPADLVVELISDDSVARDRADKFYEYQEAGVGEYWIVDPRPGKQRVDFFHLAPDGKYQALLPEAGGRYHSPTLPGFWLSPDWLWQDPLPKPLTLLMTIAPDAVRSALTSPDSQRSAGEAGS
jgi:Uma2 family endonuclease